MNDQRVMRRTIYVGDSLHGLIASGRVLGETVSERLDRLADRYTSMITDLVPTRWHVHDWLVIAQVISEVQVARATDASVVSVRLRQLSKKPGASPETGALAYRFENLKLAEQLAVIDVAERAKQADVATQDAMSKWLAEQSIQVG